jgi:hypothetical protein
LLKPLDLQTIVTRAVDVQRMQQIQNTRPDIEQQQFSQELKHQFELNQTKVIQAAASHEGEKIQNQAFDDASRPPTHRYRRFFSKKKPVVGSEEEEEPSVAPKTGPGQHIDIKI